MNRWHGVRQESGPETAHAQAEPSQATPPLTWIVGVAGKTWRREDEPDEQSRRAFEQAEEIGGWIARMGQVVLTGGHHRAEERSVKFRALMGAKRVADSGSAARLLGIVPKALSERLGWTRRPGVEPSKEADLPLRFLYLHTDLKSHQRNPITGGAPDVLIALHGDNGTIEEVSAAAEAKRPVVFVGSRERLERGLRAKGLSLPDIWIEVDSAEAAVAEALHGAERAAPLKLAARWEQEYSGLYALYQPAMASLTRIEG